MKYRIGVFTTSEFFKKIFGGMGSIQISQKIDVDFYAKIWVFLWDQIKIFSK